MSLAATCAHTNVHITLVLVWFGFFGGWADRDWITADGCQAHITLIAQYAGEERPTCTSYVGALPSRNLVGNLTLFIKLFSLLSIVRI